LRWIDDEKIDWLCNTFCIAPDWMDGERNTRPHDGFYFNKDPKRFYETITEELKREPNSLGNERAKTLFMIDSDKNGAEQDTTVRLLLAIAIPLYRLSNEVTVYRYLFDDVGGGYPWNDPPYHKHLRVVARLCYQHFHFETWGVGFPHAEFEAIAEGELFIPEVLQKPGRHHALWHPEDYCLAASESAVAQETETLVPLLEWMDSEGLPTSQRYSGAPIDSEK
ncbi:MAG: hypothetical protein ACQKBU_00470, partial [Verrucomicrobiales bacterium]